ncbi:MAG TPA: asparagine synthase (glutamine-hydrolyzing) [Tepidisphaeraceae bacterium]|nr:asparagine synthase (glutamine-hydrolyzing) [Tepidisphaeraceae bacterium]
MCGIAGFFGSSFGDADGRAVLRRMVAAIRHRGPDEQGMYAEDGVGLGHARLSIIDLSTGQQPMRNEDGAVWVSFNGEIFNYVELAADLKARGHVFRTHSDTETIVHAYEERGPACVEDFNGDFAFALFDRRNDRLMLARDRMGVRPVYYTVQDGALLFASEVKALLAYPGVKAELDPVALDQTFTFWFPLAPRTAFKGISELPPGHVLVAERGGAGRVGAGGELRIAVRPYWQLKYPARGEGTGLEGRSEESVADELRDLLIDSTRLRLRSDVPVGAYLSGGLDSSITTALIKLFTNSKLRTFSVEFEAEEFDESQFQRQMVQALGTEHESVVCTRSEIGAMFPDVVRHTERPVVRTAPAPMFALARLARDSGFKVVMTGEGADEVLAGYDIFKEAKVRRFWAHQPNSAWRPLLLRRLYPYLSGIQSQPQAYLQAFFRIGLDRPNDPLFSHLPRFEVTARNKSLFSAGLRDSVRGYDAMEAMRQQLPADFSGWHPLNQSQYLETAYLLPAYLLSSQGDRVAMAHAVEGRYPFLDHRVAEFAAKIPPRMKLKGLREKHILRRSMERHLPQTIAKRHKQPYRAPDSESFFGRHAPEYVEEMLSTAAISRAGYFDPPAVQKLVQKCRAGGNLGFKDNMALVSVLSVQLLHHLFVSGRVFGEPAALKAAGA